MLCEPFQKLPSRRRYADYFKEIKNPIALEQIQAKVLREEYNSLNELAADLSLMFDNAKQYNRPDSKIFKDAARLHKAMQVKFQEISEEDVIFSLLSFFIIN